MNKIIQSNLAFSAAVILLFCNCVFAQGGIEMKLTSKEFKHNDFIPDKFTCRGQDINPSLTIEGLPSGTRSLVLIVDDPDAPSGTWVHWIVFNIPVTNEINEDSIPGVQGRNSSLGNDFHGPCPPFGTHHYFFKLYALDSILDLGEGATKKQVESAMAGHILADAELIGLCQKK